MRHSLGVAMLIPPEVAPGAMRSTFPTWEVYLYLGDQCSIALAMLVTARTESEAIAEARQSVALAWPQLFADCSIDSTPASAMCLHRNPPSTATPTATPVARTSTAPDAARKPRKG